MVGFHDFFFVFGPLGVHIIGIRHFVPWVNSRSLGVDSMMQWHVLLTAFSRGVVTRVRDKRNDRCWVWSKVGRCIGRGGCGSQVIQDKVESVFCEIYQLPEVKLVLETSGVRVIQVPTDD